MFKFKIYVHPSDRWVKAGVWLRSTFSKAIFLAASFFLLKYSARRIPIEKRCLRLYSTRPLKPTGHAPPEKLGGKRRQLGSIVNNRNLSAYSVSVRPDGTSTTIDYGLKNGNAKWTMSTRWYARPYWGCLFALKDHQYAGAIRQNSQLGIISDQQHVSKKTLDHRDTSLRSWQQWAGT